TVGVLDDVRGRRTRARFTHAGRRADAARLTHALGAERIARRRRAGLLDQDVGHLVGARHRVFHQRARDELAVTVVDDRFLERLSQALGEAAVELSLGEERIDHGARVVDPDQPLDDDAPRLALDAKRAEDGPESPDLRVGLEVHARLEARRVAG